MKLLLSTYIRFAITLPLLILMMTVKCVMAAEWAAQVMTRPFRTEGLGGAQ